MLQSLSAKKAINLSRIILLLAIILSMLAVLASAYWLGGYVKTQQFTLQTLNLELENTRLQNKLTALQQKSTQDFLVRESRRNDQQLIKEVIRYEPKIIEKPGACPRVSTGSMQQFHATASAIAQD